MKPIHLNLASRPFRDYRPVYAAVVLMALLTAFLALNNVDTFLRYRTETKTTRANIAKLEGDIAAEQRKTDSLSQRLKGVDLKLLASQTEFANAQLAERAFSWSELLDRLERVLPNDVRLHSVTPSFDKDGLVHLAMTCVTKTGDGLTATINRFNADPHFANAFPTSETQVLNEYQFTLGVDYRPSIARRVE
ncbi:MAG: type pilus assembly protein PilN [Thermoanaerobaculia bacterium]|nr:type pilus assembly protein PilN [Thermoanaerobaculia bacterium]